MNPEEWTEKYRPTLDDLGSSTFLVPRFRSEQRSLRGRVGRAADLAVPQSRQRGAN